MFCIERDYYPLPPQTALTPIKAGRFTEELDIAQGKLSMGFITPVNNRHPQLAEFQAFNVIFGAGMTSKLFMNVRERLSLCYYCSSYYDIFKGALFVSCGVAPENRDKAEGEILNQLSEIVNGNISEEEFEAAKHSLCNSYRSISDSPALIENYYFCRSEFGVACSLGECMERIRAVTLADVIRMAASVRLDTVYFLSGNGEEDEDAAD